MTNPETQNSNPVNLIKSEYQETAEPAPNKRKISSTVLTIINTETYWYGGLMTRNRSVGHDDPRYSERLDP
jgi:hypothetical protein